MALVELGSRLGADRSAASELIRAILIAVGVLTRVGLIRSPTPHQMSLSWGLPSEPSFGHTSMLDAGPST